MKEVICSLNEDDQKYDVIRYRGRFYKQNNTTGDIYAIPESEYGLYDTVCELKDNMTSKNVVANKKKAHLLNLKLAGFILAWGTALGATISLTFLAGQNIIEHYSNKKANTTIDKDSLDDLKSEFNKKLVKNKTLNSFVREELKMYFQILLDRGLDEKVYKLIIKNLNKLDFSDSNKVTVELLEELFAGNENASFIASELYNYYNETDTFNNELYRTVANILSFNDESIALIMEGKPINDVLKDCFNIEESKTLTENTNLPMEEYLSKEFASLNASSISSYLDCNIFEPYIKVYDAENNCFLYYDKQTKESINYQIYYKKLLNLLATKEKLDYNDPKDRELVYLYANAFLETENTTPDVVSFIIDGAISSYTHFSQYDLMSSLSGNTLNRDNICLLASIGYYGKEAVPLMQEINLCLKKDLEEGYVSQEDYDLYYEKALAFVNLKAPEMYNSFLDANESNRSMPGYRLKIFSPIDV